ncbi:hypothetical protein ABPG75_009779 [Micractinium tetrahymenae]
MAFPPTMPHHMPSVTSRFCRWLAKRAAGKVEELELDCFPIGYSVKWQACGGVDKAKRHIDKVEPLLSAALGGLWRGGSLRRLRLTMDGFQGAVAVLGRLAQCPLPALCQLALRNGQDWHAAAESKEEYLAELRAALRPAFCVHNFPSPQVERHNKPVVEEHPAPPPGLVFPTRLECALIEQSINSTRVSFRFRAADATEEYLLRTFLHFMVHRADDLDIVRRVPLPTYDLTFLVTWRHLERYRQDALVDFICKARRAGMLL